MSVAGGLHLAFERIRRVGGESLQIFTRNQRQWHAAPISSEERNAFRKARDSWGNWPLAVHNSYLINLASHNEDVRVKSVGAMTAEVERVVSLDIPYLIMHPGSHGGDGVDAGLERFVKNLDTAIESAKNAEGVMILIENTAGQGTSLGATLSQLGYILNTSACGDRLGICIDTCHLFASGYDFRTLDEYDKTLQQLEKEVGIQRIRFFHLNDSKRELGSKIDRHEHIGRGQIGKDGFRNLLNDSRFSMHPMTLETPKGEDLLEDMENLAVLRSLITTNNRPESKIIG